MNAPFRLPTDRWTATGVNRDAALTVRLDDREVPAHPGDTVASALLAQGRIRCGDSMYLGRPRGVLTAGVEEPNALVKVAPRTAADVAESMLPATTVELTDGLRAEYLRLSLIHI